MGFWETISGGSNAILPSEEGFGWSTAGAGTKYLLITVDGGRPTANVYGATKAGRSELLLAIDPILREKKECLLLGIETHEVTCKFFQLDPTEARQRLGA